jgi:sodium/hydrogen antiporter
MVDELLAIVAGLTLVLALLGNRLDRLDVTVPMASILAGIIVFGIHEVTALDASSVHAMAEMALVIILFHDASTVRLGKLRRDKGVPIRLLVVGFPLALLSTFVTGLALLPALGAAGALLLAAAVTPTDAGLGAPTILNPRVPVRVRRALNVESGLNDGLATPLVLFALALLAEQEGVRLPIVLQVGLVSVFLAVALAVVVGLGSAWFVRRSLDRGWTSSRDRSIAVLVTPLLLLGLAGVIGANGFIAAFVGGLTFGAAPGRPAADESTVSLLETAADLLGVLIWFLAGGLVLLALDHGFSWQWPVLAVLALTVLRIVPVSISLLGSGLRTPSVLFIGWFGPRGLATIVFALLAVEELGADHGVIPDVTGVVAFIVTISVFAHGISARPCSRRYGEWADRVRPPAEHAVATEPLPARGRTRSP